MKPSDLIQKYRPEQAEFEVRLDEESVFRFRVISDYAELKAQKEGAEKFVRNLMRGKFDAVPGWAGLKPEDPEIASMVFFLHATCIEPKWTQQDWLTLAREAAWVFELVNSKMQQGQTRARSEVEISEAERLGESSSPTPGVETS